MSGFKLPPLIVVNSYFFFVFCGVESINVLICMYVFEMQASGLPGGASHQKRLT